MKRGQSAVEYTMLIGILLVALIPLFYYATKESQENIKLNQVDDMLNKIINGADLVYTLGPGSRTVVTINVPSGVKEFQINGNAINIKINIRGSVSDVHANTKAPNAQLGTLDGQTVDKVIIIKGIHHLPIHTDDLGNVIIGE